MKIEMVRAADGILRSFIERLMRLDSEISDMQADKSEVYKEAASSGFNKAALRVVIQRLRKDPTKLAELEEVVALYWRSYHAGVPAAAASPTRKVDGVGAQEATEAEKAITASPEGQEGGKDEKWPSRARARDAETVDPETGEILPSTLPGTPEGQTAAPDSSHVSTPKRRRGPKAGRVGAVPATAPSMQPNGGDAVTDSSRGGVAALSVPADHADAAAPPAGVSPAAPAGVPVDVERAEAAGQEASFGPGPVPMADLPAAPASVPEEDDDLLDIPGFLRCQEIQPQQDRTDEGIF